MSDEKVIDVVVINGERREAVETFRACGVNWWRWKMATGENRYTTEVEWNHWKSETPERL
jgi:hypothetical protein